MTQEKTFILGLGHQKCGTSWFYKYLAQSEYFREGFRKEYHIWDGLDLQSFQHLRARPTLWGRARHALTKSGDAEMRHKMQNSQSFYFDYFASLYTGQTRLTADITPSYSGLKADRLRHIRDGFQSRGIATKAVIFIRDPLSRIKSAVRFNLDRGNFKEGIHPGETDFEQALAQYYTSEHCDIRTRYDQTITEAQKVFDENQLYIGIYETMFTPEEVARLSDFLGVETNAEFASIKVNKTRSAVSLTDLDNDIRDHYSAVYDFCYANFPQTRSLWS